MGSSLPKPTGDNGPYQSSTCRRSYDRSERNSFEKDFSKSWSSRAGGDATKSSDLERTTQNVYCRYSRCKYFLFSLEDTKTWYISMVSILYYRCINIRSFSTP
ncbi:hypothetical protein Tcan_13413 [Toxocara canis]|uniref:Uncharacterized protein n=1 Tax=Toxocara canis TaxID=6265 RepID=A0A0B2VAL3_TOXCA|nr:hypothetical protein Tcan_13413 [Toxocara canis]